MNVITGPNILGVFALSSAISCHLLSRKHFGVTKIRIVNINGFGQDYLEICRRLWHFWVTFIYWWLLTSSLNYLSSQISEY